jgi:hypothetical protein
MNEHRVNAFLKNEMLMSECVELAKLIKNDIEFYENELEQYNWDLDYLEEDDEDEPEEPMMIWSDEIESLLEQSLDHMIGQF